jgi:hypothetical protein
MAVEIKILGTKLFQELDQKNIGAVQLKEMFINEFQIKKYKWFNFNQT